VPGIKGKRGGGLKRRKIDANIPITAERKGKKDKKGGGEYPFPFLRPGEPRKKNPAIFAWNAGPISEKKKKKKRERQKKKGERKVVARSAARKRVPSISWRPRRWRGASVKGEKKGRRCESRHPLFSSVALGAFQREGKKGGRGTGTPAGHPFATGGKKKMQEKRKRGEGGQGSFPIKRGRRRGEGTPMNSQRFP